MKINSFWGDLTDISAKRKHWLCGFQPPALHHLPPHKLYLPSCAGTGRVTGTSRSGARPRNGMILWRRSELMSHTLINGF